LSFQEDAIGIRLRDVIGVDNIAEDEQAKIAGGNTARVYHF
jgi:hypothetical protein